ncbi:putative nucleolar protein [Besnoitia besnoiti]|uniref:Nucleolar protein 56 n=1 Tax=Besnoitia besnoiti TaxID=94643 RepID=A0A2A9MNR5_BESBE|nr:putative nucleolar protein [Besnoitia besnoiti]PFH38231.1 putative nucleolar protein [Besnoitia besnoiti]
MAANDIFLLFESAPGLLLARVKGWDQIAQHADAVQEACLDFARFKQVVEVVAFHPFSDAEEAMEVQLAITGGTSCPTLVNFLNFNLPSSLKKKKSDEAAEGASKSAVGVCDPALGKSLADAGFQIVFNSNIQELHRGCRQHMKKLAKQLGELPIEKFQVGLGHSYSRSKMQEDPRKQDKPIMQSIALLDSLDKNINAFAMKLKEWYGWHFPELVKIVGDTEVYCRVLKVVQVKEKFDPEAQADELLEACGGSEEIRDEVVAATKHSMGQEVGESDFVNIVRFADQVLRLCEQRKSLQDYLATKMDFVSPNLKAVVGEVLAARLISHAGALVNLAKYPASTIQILGAEKALFRALKSKNGRTPKYGLLFHSSFIGRVQKQQHRGRMSRYLASKCALAARIDAFGDDADEKGVGADGVRSNIYGLKLREQLEERLKYLADGIVPRKNLDVMREAASELQSQATAAASEKKKKKKRKHEDAEEAEEEANPLMDAEGEKKKKKKKKHAQAEDAENEFDEDLAIEKKKKKKKKDKSHNDL